MSAGEEEKETDVMNALKSVDFLNELNQDLMHQVGMHTLVFDFLKTKYPDKADISPELIHSVGPDRMAAYRYSFAFLYYFALNNDKNSLALSKPEVMRGLISHLRWWPGVEVIAVLTEILEDSSVANEHLEHGDIELIVGMLVDEMVTNARAGPGQGNWARAVRLIGLLKSVIESEKGDAQLNATA